MFIDIAVGLLLFSWLFRGYRRGLLGEVVHLGGVVLGVMFAGNLVRMAAEKVEPHLDKIRRMSGLRRCTWVRSSSSPLPSGSLVR